MGSLGWVGRMEPAGGATRWTRGTWRPISELRCHLAAGFGTEEDDWLVSGDDTFCDIVLDFRKGTLDWRLC